MRKLTHGEASFIRRENIDFTLNFSQICAKINNLPKRMNRYEALEYYGAKFRKYFGLDEVQLRDFDRSEDSLFGYYEAKRLLEAMKCQNQAR
jgi:hypothetical protein